MAIASDGLQPSVSPEMSGEKRTRKQAVVIVHGMGEQRPMSTLRGFVDAMWTRNSKLDVPDYAKDPDPSGKGKINKLWITPDDRTGSHEQRRVTTPSLQNGRRTDFFELYWADITQGNTRGRLGAWVASLLLRKRSDIPADARKLYCLTLVLVVLVGLAALALAFSSWQGCVSWPIAAAIVFVASAIFWAIDQFGLPYFGDVVAYVRAEASTVEKRALVRERGLGLLKRLLDDPEYDRIVLVSHSLGSVIAYDLMQILWAEYRPRDLEWKQDRPIIEAVHGVEKFAVLPGELFGQLATGTIEDLRRAQWALYEQLRGADRRLGKGWKISDFVTVGSPLTHAEFLVTHNRADWTKGVRERLFSVCPPISDKEKSRLLLYEQRREDETDPVRKSIHHGATFAATRWTNIYDIGNLWSTGDPISGSLEENFGPGVRNVQVAMHGKVLGRRSRLSTHTLYWSLDDDDISHVEALREALDLEA